MLSEKRLIQSRSETRAIALVRKDKLLFYIGESSSTGRATKIKTPAKPYSSKESDLWYCLSFVFVHSKMLARNKNGLRFQPDHVHKKVYDE